MINKGRSRGRPPAPGARAESLAAAFADRRRCAEVIGTLSLLSNERRLRMLCALNEGDLCVADLARAVGGRISGVSQQLKMLTLAGLLERRREEKSVIYHLRDPRLKRILHFLKDQFPHR